MSRRTEASVYFPLPYRLMMLRDDHFDTPFFTCIFCPGAGGGRRGGMHAICGTYNVSLWNSKRSSAHASLTRPSPCVFVYAALSLCVRFPQRHVCTDISPEHPHTLELFPMLACGSTLPALPWGPASQRTWANCVTCGSSTVSGELGTNQVVYPGLQLQKAFSSR